MDLTTEPIGYSHHADPGEPTTGKPRLSISDNEAEILSALAAGKVVLEIGTGLGVSTRALARHAFMVDTVDPDAWVHQTIVPELIRDHPNVLAVDNRKLLAPPYDLIFIDGSHDTSDVTNDIMFAENLLGAGGLIVCHDARYSNVRAALTHDDWRFIETEHVLAWRCVR